MKIVILTEGGKTNGFGHVSRCSSLAQAFHDEGAAVDYVINGDETTRELLEGTAYVLSDWLQRDQPIEHWFSDADIVVVDSYVADEEVYRRVASTAPVSVFMDDDMRIEYPPAVIVNGAIGAERRHYTFQPDSDYLLGSRYTLLRLPFASSPQITIKDSIQSVILLAGGNDCRGITPLILKTLAENYSNLHKIVVIGRQFDNIGQIENGADRLTDFVYFPTGEQLKAAMLRADVAISAGGQTLYELARVGVPTIGVTVAENQRLNVAGWEQEGFVFNAGWWARSDLLCRIAGGLEGIWDRNVRQAMSNSGRRRMDGLGSKRIAKFCVKKRGQRRVDIRRAEHGDVEAVYRLSNDQGIRQCSFNTHRIDWAEHQIWFRKQISDPNHIFLVATDVDGLAGQLRLKLKDNETEVSISVDRTRRGSGVGRRLLKWAVEQIRRDHIEITQVHALVKQENQASCLFFENNGFILTEKSGVRKQGVKKYTYFLEETSNDS